MARISELKNIIRLAQKRRATLLKRLDLACAKQDDAKADQLRGYLAYENELIYNANKDLEAVE